MTSTLYARGSRYGTSLHLDFMNMFETSEEAEAAYPEFEQLIQESLPDKLFWQPETSELYLWDINNPMTEEEDAAFDWDQLVVAASNKILEKYA